MNLECAFTSPYHYNILVSTATFSQYQDQKKSQDFSDSVSHQGALEKSPDQETKKHIQYHLHPQMEMYIFYISVLFLTVLYKRDSDH